MTQKFICRFPNGTLVQSRNEAYELQVKNGLPFDVYELMETVPPSFEALHEFRRYLTTIPDWARAQVIEQLDAAGIYFTED